MHDETLEPNTSQPPHLADTESGRTASFHDSPAPLSMLIGRYRLLERIGEGGMGTVWMAEQTAPVRRRVAVKLINAERATTTSILGRFEAERQAIALMDHPHIARLLDAGTTDAGAPFFVMELVKGVPLTDYCDAHQLPIHERLRLFVAICTAVQHAHQKGIIHRDLKPSNILVETQDGKAIPKIIDFGLAKATSGMRLSENTLYTGFGSVMGTPLYMAPEQASANAVDVDTRADLYALGVILFELLTGTTPISRETIRQVAFDEVLRLVREQEAPAPSVRLKAAGLLPEVAAKRQSEPARLGRFVRGELDWIVAKALSKERDRRYETASGFARDVERFLNHEPVLAGPPSASYRLRKFARRNRGPVLAASLVMIALVLGIIGTTWGMLQANRARAAEAEQRAEAEEANRHALAALESFTDNVMEKQFASRTVLTENEKAILRNALKQWEVFAQSKGQTPQAHAIRAQGAQRVANVQGMLGMNAEAEANYRQAIALGQQLTAEQPHALNHWYDLARSHNNLGLLLGKAAKQSEAEEHFRRSIEIGEKIAAESPDTADYRYALAGSLCNLGNTAWYRGEKKEADKHYDQSLVILATLTAEEPGSPKYRHRTAILHHCRARVASSLGKEELDHFHTALDIESALVTEFPDAPEYQSSLARIHHDFGSALDLNDRSKDAEEHYRRALAIHRTLAASFPAVPDYRGHLARHLSYMATSRVNRGKPQEAVELYREAIDLQEQLVASHPTIVADRSSLADSHNDLGIHLAARKDPATAERHYRRAIELREQLIAELPGEPAQRSRLGRHYHNLAMLQWTRGDRADAITLYRKALAIREELTNQFPDDLEYQRELGGSCSNIASMLATTEDSTECWRLFAKAISLLTTALESDRQQPGTTRQYLCNTYRARAHALMDRQKYAEALADLDKVAPLVPQNEQAGVRFERAYLHVELGQVAAGIAELDSMLGPLTEPVNTRAWSAGQWYDIAGVYALAGGKDTPKKTEYAERAMKLLQIAVKAGFKNSKLMAGNKKLDSLREREDFKKLLAELGSRQ